jgi:serine/threonine protein kinase
MNNCSLGSLDMYLKNKKMTKMKTVNFCLHISLGLSAMHGRDLAHGDIKPTNVLIDLSKEGKLKCVITDFGIAQILSANLAVTGFDIVSVKGLSYCYCSPETFKRFRNKSSFNDKPAVVKAGDVYAFSSTTYEATCRKAPWK